MKPRTTPAVRTLLVLAELLLLASCGQTPASLSDPCSLLTPQEVTRSLDTNITTAHPQTDNPKYTLCNYYNPVAKNPADNPMVILQINSQQFTADGFKRSFTAANMTYEELSGIGDAAFYAPVKNAADGTLFVIKDGHSFSIAIVHSPQDPAASKHTAEMLAQLALSRYH
jgi:hypothetical protein